MSNFSFVKAFNTHTLGGAFAIGIGLLAIPFFALCLASLFFICNQPINPFIFPLAIVLSLVLLFFETKKISRWMYVSFIVLLITAISIFFSLLFYDYAFDGQWYHQDIMQRMVKGWNPFYTWHSHEPIVHSDIWVNHYAKGLETISATIYSFVGNIESGKSVNFIITIASGFLCFSLLHIIFTFLSTSKRLFFSLIFILCPVVLSQILTHNIDWASYILMLILILALCAYAKQPIPLIRSCIVAVIILMISSKFNLFFWCGFAILCYLIYWYCTKKMQPFYTILKTAIASACFTIIVISFNPYICNTVEHKHPMYPLMGKDKIEIIDIITPSFLKDVSRVESIGSSVFSFPKVHLNSSDDFPFISMHITDARLNGWGNFFSFIIILSLALYSAVIIGKKDIFHNKERMPYSIFLAILLGAMFILPAGWYARYFPFFYAFPLVICLYLEKEKNTFAFLKLRYVIYMLLIINIINAIPAIQKKVIAQKTKIENILEILSQSKEIPRIHFDYNAALKIKLDEAHIPYMIPKTKELRAKLKLALPLHPAVYLDTAQYQLQNNILYDKNAH